MTRLKHILFLHLKVGCTTGAFLFPLFLIVLVGMDVIRTWMANSNPFIALTNGYKMLWVINGLMLSIFLALVVPVCLAPWMAGSQGRHYISRMCRYQSKTSIIIYIILCVILGSCVGICHNLEGLSGNAYVNGEYRPAVRSFLLAIVEQVPAYLWPTVCVLFTILGGIRNFVDLTKIRRPIDWGAYISRLELTALPSRFTPRHKQYQLDFDSGRTAPILMGIQSEWIRLLKKYHELVPGSNRAAEYLEKTWSEVKQLLKDHGIKEEPGKQLRLVTSTGRALEIAFNEVCSGTHVILSPYEHPTEKIVAAVGHKVQAMSVNLDFFDKSWSEQKAAIANWVRNIFNSLSEESTTFVISEVCWFTGRCIPVCELIEEIRKENGAERKLTIVVDGAHAVGNLAGTRPVGLCDAYVFSGHKWLFAPEPCGLVITNKAVRTYDVWVDALPDTTVGAAQVCGLYASLQFLRSLKEDMRIQRSRYLKDSFRKELRDGLEIVGEKSNLSETNLITVRPAPNYMWMVSAVKLRQLLLQQNIRATVIERLTVDRNNVEKFWVRCSFGWFLDWRAIRDLAKLLNYYLTLEVLPAKKSLSDTIIK
jgi:selenocysteine lyase/cysteine desulfurase